MVWAAGMVPESNDLPYVDTRYGLIRVMNQ
jgi:hypothetical protein